MHASYHTFVDCLLAFSSSYWLRRRGAEIWRRKNLVLNPKSGIRYKFFINTRVEPYKSRRAMVHASYHKFKDHLLTFSLSYWLRRRRRQNMKYGGAKTLF